MMKEKMILKHEKSTRIFHWVNLVIFLALLFSGLAIFNPNFRFFAFLFGDLRGAAELHKYFGIAYLVVPLIYIVTHFKLFKKFIARIADFDEDDHKWLKISGGYMAPLIKGEPPEQGKFNAGQKSLGWIIIVVSCILGITGLIMMFYTQVPPVLVRYSYLIHAASGLFIGCGILVHFYLAAIHPKSSKECKTMMGNGYIEAEFAKHHNAKWYREVAKEDKSSEK